MCLPNYTVLANPDDETGGAGSRHPCKGVKLTHNMQGRFTPGKDQAVDSEDKRPKSGLWVSAAYVKTWHNLTAIPLTIIHNRGPSCYFS